MHVHLDPLLVTQHGLVTRRQAWELGVTSDQVDSLLERKLLVPVYRGVFRDPAVPVTLDQRALAAVLAAGRGSAVSHRQAVALWGTRNYQCLLSEITAPGVHTIPGVFSHRSTRPPQQTVLRNIPVTTTARTIIDVAPFVGPAILGKWLEHWLSSKMLKLDDLEEQMVALTGHSGVPVARSALTDRTLLHAVTDSPPEAALGLLLANAGLPPLTLHHLVTVPSGAAFELDWSLPQWLVAFEMDGYGVHLRSLEAFEHDRYRRNELEIEGWTILNFTKRQVERRSNVVVNQVRRSIEGRSRVD